ncbi:MAG: hypothetical protein N2512_15185 [Armatimonadetes bacterium]|nr:hypothetical protein [Armatimonadota bacterium]
MRQAIVGVLVALLVPGASLAATTIVGWDFEQGQGPFQTIDLNGQLGLAVGQAQAAQGSASLHLKFPRVKSMAEMQQRGMPGSIMGQLPAPPTPPPSCLEFAVKAKLRTPLLVVVNEQDGSSYIRPICVEPGGWRTVKLFWRNFALEDNSMDENGQLDGGQIGVIAFVDASFFLAALAEQARPAGISLPAIDTGENEIWLDDISLTDEEPGALGDLLTDASGSVPLFIPIVRPDAMLERLPDGLAGKPCWKITYAAAEREITGLWCGASREAFVGTSGVHISAKPLVRTVLILQTKERDGSEYNAVLDIPDGQTEDRHIPWPEFRLGDNSTDENGRLDPDQLKEFGLLDVTSVFGGAGPRQNELLLGVLELMR